jgi:hypothetical protein
MAALARRPIGYAQGVGGELQRGQGDDFKTRDLRTPNDW